MRLRLSRPQIGAAALLLLAAVLSVAANSHPGAAAPVTRLSQPASPGDWPTYGHDNSRTNFNPDENIISAGNVNQLVQRWQVNVGSNGTPTSGAPSVLNGVVYVPSSAASPNNNFFAFDAASGAQVWAENIGYRSTCFNVGIGAAPAISGTQVVEGADNAAANPAYYGINTVNGSVVWTNTMNVGTSGFPWASPLLAYGRAYVGISSDCDNPSVRGELRAVDMTNGNTINSAYFVPAGQRGGGIWNSPAMSPDGSIIAVGTGEDYLGCACGPYTRAMVALDPQTLTILGYHQEPSPGQDLDFGTTPVIFHDSQNRTLVAAGHKNNTFYAYDLSNVSAGAIWTRPGGTTIGLMPAYDPTLGNGGTLFVVTSSLVAVDPANGNVRWGPVSIPSSHGNIAIANGLIFINGGSSGLQIRNESDGSLLRTINPPNAGAAYSGVVVSHGFIYWLSGSYINAWSLPPGTTPTPNTPTPVPPTSTRTVTPTPGTPLPVTHTPTALPSSTGTPVVTAISTGTPAVTPISTQVATSTATTPPQVTSTATAPPGSSTGTPVPPSPTACPIQFSDVLADNPFYPYVRCLACQSVLGGYGDGTFRPNNNVTRGQLSKIVSNAANINDAIPSDRQTYSDVPPSETFWLWIERLSQRGDMGGYPCGGPGEPCDAQQRPYFRPGSNATRGQIAKLVSNAAGYGEDPHGQFFADVPSTNPFYQWIQRLATRGIMGGYACGGPGEPCDQQQRPYFRWASNATRGQTAKIVSNTFFPNCNTPARR